MSLPCPPPYPHPHCPQRCPIVFHCPPLSPLSLPLIACQFLFITEGEGVQTALKKILYKRNKCQTIESHLFFFLLLCNTPDVSVCWPKKHVQVFWFPEFSHSARFYFVCFLSLLSVVYPCFVFCGCGRPGQRWYPLLPTACTSLLVSPSNHESW